MYESMNTQHNFGSMKGKDKSWKKFDKRNIG